MPLVKKKYIRGNNALFMNKTVGKEIMKTSNLRNTYLRSINETDKEYKQRNSFESLLRKTKRICIQT